MKKKTLTPKTTEEEVQITELPADDVTETITDSVVVVTQPKEKEEITDKRVEEEVIVVEQTKTGKTIRKVKKPVKTEEEVIVEIEEVGGKKRVIKKKLTAHRSDVSEEILDQEDTDELKPFETQTQKQIPLETHSVLSEAVTTSQVTEIEQEKVSPDSVSVQIIPHSAVSGEQVLPDEKEQYHDKLKPSTVTAKSSVDTVEAYQVTEEDVQNLTGIFDKEFRPKSFSASPAVLSNESVTVEEVQEGQTVKTIDKERTPQDTASFSLLLKEAAAVSQTEAVQNEEILEDKPLPKTSQATKSYTTKEGITIEEIQEGQREGDLDIPKTITSKSKVYIDTVESLIVEEVYTDNKPGKHLPEAFVPTEVANTRMIPQKQLLSSEIVAPELEGEFTPGRLPPAQSAGVDVTIAEGLLVEQVSSETKETDFTEAAPNTGSASEEIILSEGVSVTVVDSQMPSKDVEPEEVEHQKAFVEYLPKESLVSTTTLVSEKEKDYQPGDVDTKQASPSLTCLEIGETSDVTMQDSEAPLQPDKKPTASIAETNIKGIIPLNVSEVQAGDTSEQFTDYPKYTTQEATSDIQTQDATQITETQPGEKEKMYEEAALATQQADTSLTDTQKEVAVTQTETMERESSLQDFELPDTYKGKQVSSHLLPTSIVEEVTTESSTGKLEDELPKEGIASVNQPLSEETVVSQAIPSESLGVYQPDKKVENKQADLTISQSESVVVTEVISDDKEKEYLSKDLPKESHATPDFDGQRVASTTEVTPNFLPELLPEDTTKSDQAKFQQTFIESLEVTQFEIAEKEGEQAPDVFPETKQALFDISEGKTVTNVTQIVSHEKEQEYTAQEQPKGVLASQNVAFQEVAIKSETELVVHADEIPEEEPQTGKAKKYARPLQELIVTEPTPVDYHKDLPKDIFPYEKKAIVNLLPGQLITSTEIVTGDKEAALDSYTTPDEKHASPAVSEQETAVQQEVVAGVHPKEFDRISPEKEHGQPQQDVSHHLTQFEHTVGEKEGLKTEEIQPDKKQVSVEFEEGKSITVMEIQSTDKEGTLAEAPLPITGQSHPEIESHTVALKTEVLTTHSSKSFEESQIPKTEANVSQSLFESLTQSELSVQEKEGVFADIKPETKTASTDLELGEGVGVQVVLAADKEKEFETLEQPKGSQAQPEITPQQTWQTTEVYPDDSFGKIDSTIPAEASATPAHIELSGIVQTETTAGESEGLFDSDKKPDEKTATFALEDVPTVPSVLQVESQDKEAQFKEFEIPSSKLADQSIDVQPVAETTVVTADSTTGDIVTEKPKESVANLEQTFLESVIQTDAVASEKEGPLKDFSVDTKSVNVDFQQGEGIKVTEVFGIDTEKDYTAEERVTQAATPHYDSLGVVQSQEVTASDNIDKFETDKPKMIAAEPSILPYDTITQSEHVLPESESIFSEELKTAPKTASVQIDEDRSVTVESVVTATKEEEMAVAELPETKKVESSMIDLKSVAETLEVVSAAQEEKFDEFKQLSVTANLENIPHESISQLQLVVGETEETFQDKPKPEEHKGNVEFQPSQSVTVSQVTTVDSSKDYETPLPGEQSAQTNVDVTHLVAQQSAVVASEDSGDFKDSAPQSSQASKTEDLLTSLVVSETSIQESEKEMSGEFKPNMSQAEIALEKGKLAQTVSETTVQDKEEKLDVKDQAEGKTAQPAIDAHEVANQMEVKSEVGVQDLKEEAPTSTTANVKQTELEGVVHSQTILGESEGTFTETLKMDTKKAEIGVTEVSSVTIAETTTTEREDVLPAKEQASTATAEANFIKSEAAQTSEVLTTASLGELPKEKLPEASATLQQEVLEGVTSTQTISMDSEKQFEEAFKPDSKTADVNLQPMSSLTVTETYTEGEEKTFDSLKPNLEQATGKIDSVTPIEATQVSTNENVDTLTPFSAPSSTAKLEQSAIESITSVETTVHEKEGPFEYAKPAESQITETEIVETRSVNVTEITAQDKESALDEMKKPSEQKASRGILPQESIELLEVQADSSIDKLSEKQPVTDVAKPTQDSFESVLVSENLTHEQETPAVIEKPDTRTADVVLLPEKHVQVSQTLTEDKEGAFETKPEHTSTAEKSVVPQAALEVTQTVSDQTFDDLRLPDTKDAKTEPVPIPLENITVTQSTFADKEDVLKPDKKPTTDVASVDVDISGKTAVISEVTTDYKESKVPDYDVHTDTASSTILEDRPVLETETNVLDSFDTLPDMKVKETRKATVKQTTVEGVTETEVTISEKEKHIETEYLQSKTAGVTISTVEGISITEINAPEQESEKVITGIAKEQTAQEDIKQHPVAVSEEVIPLSDTKPLERADARSATAKAVEPTQQHGVIVSEKRSTGELDSVPYVLTPDKRKGRMVVEDTTATVSVTEIELHDREGKSHIILSSALNFPRRDHFTVHEYTTHHTTPNV